MVRSALLACVCCLVCVSPADAGKPRISRLVKKFNRAVEQQEWEKAEQLVEQATEKFPDAPTVQLMQRQFDFISNQTSTESKPPRLTPAAAALKAVPLPENDVRRQPSTELSSVEVELFAALEQRCSFQFDDVPLRKALIEICGATGINIVLDERGLQKIDVSSDSPVNLKTQNVSLRSTLHLILDPLDLKFRIEDEVLKVSNEFRGSFLEVRTYPVADLVVPFPGQQIIHRKNGRELLTDRQELLDAESNSLIKLIQSNIATDSWSEADGGGSIHFYPTTFSLVIRQKSSVHSEVCDLLERLRRLHDIQPVIESKILTVPNSFPVTFDADGQPDESVELAFLDNTHRVLNAKATQAFLNALQQSARGSIYTAPKVTLFNGQTVELEMSDFGGDDIAFGIRAVASADRKAVRCDLVVKTDREKSNAASELAMTFQDRQSVLIDLGPTDANNTRKLLLVNASVIAPAE